MPEERIIWYFCQRDQNMQKQAKKEAKQKQELENALTIARQANRARSVFLRNMSHDIRTPLNAIIGFARLAMKSAGLRAVRQSWKIRILQIF